MNSVMKKTDDHIKALMMTGLSHGLLEKDIKDSHEKGNPFPLSILKQALAIKCRSYATRQAVVNTLRREIRRQESEQQREQAA